MTTNKILIDRRTRLENQLKDRGISGYEVKYLPYLEFDESSFATAYEVGVRMIILYSCAYVAHNLDETEATAYWLRQEKLWPDVSPEEKKLFTGEIKDEDNLIDFSWRLEAAYTLAWALKLVKELHPPTSQIDEEQMTDFQANMPNIGDKLSSYLNNLSLRDKGEIFDENVFNELATTYFRDLLFNGKTDTTDIDRSVSFERHIVLNWVRRFSDIAEWDDTDTST
ncbi:MAG: hypothetical protein C0490_20105 [Marivirga sp.]|nr:hypothetical protein [Marivirga sp.]